MIFNTELEDTVIYIRLNHKNYLLENYQHSNRVFLFLQKKKKKNRTDIRTNILILGLQ